VTSACPTEPDRPRYIAALASVGAISTIVSMVSPLIVNALVVSTPLSLPQAGYAASIETAGSCIGNLLAIFLSRRIGPRKLIGAGLILMMGGNFLCYHIGGFASFAAVRAAAGFGCGLTNVWGGLIVQTSRPQRNYAIYMGVTNFAVAVLGAGVPLLVHWQGVGAVYGAIGLFPLLCLAALGALPSAPSCQPVPGEVASADRLRKFAASAMQFLFFFSLSIVWVFLSDFGSRGKIGDSLLSTTVSLGWLLVAPLGSIASGYLEGKASASKSVFFSSLLFIGIVVSLWAGRGPTLFCAAVILFILAWAFVVPAMIHIVAEIDSSGVLGIVANLLAILGFAVGPAVGAAILQNSSLGALVAASILGFALMIVTIPLAGQRFASK
jgi:predicted MFS family arabinose efflux permease